MTDVGPGHEFEPVSPLDVPAFLRRQNEAWSAPAAVRPPPGWPARARG